MKDLEYADLWLKIHYGDGGTLSEYQAAKYVAAIMNYKAAGSNERKEMILTLQNAARS